MRKNANGTADRNAAVILHPLVSFVIQSFNICLAPHAPAASILVMFVQQPIREECLRGVCCLNECVSTTECARADPKYEGMRYNPTKTTT